MADFAATVYPVREILDHPDADLLEIAQVQDYRCVVGKGTHRAGDLVAYIPEGSLVPDDVLEELGLTGRLAGSKHNRVKAIKLRGVVSQGILYPVTGKFLELVNPDEGSDVTEVLGIEKWVPQVPAHMDGEVVPNELYGTCHYDIENVKREPDLIAEGEEVYYTEKLHGTLCAMGSVRTEEGWKDFVASKGMLAKGLMFDPEAERNKSNIYVQCYLEHRERLASLRERLSLSQEVAASAPDLTSVLVLGEIYGRGVQDLHYGLNVKAYKIFDVRIGTAEGARKYLGPHAMSVIHDFPTVPVLFCGAHSKEAMLEHTDGESVEASSWGPDPGRRTHIREGIVIRAAEGERRILKSVSDDYLLRKGGTEWN